MMTLRELGEGVFGASQIALTLTLSPLLRPWYSKWGATPEELSDWLPGDELIPQAQYQFTHGVTIHATRATVWQWLVQIGYGRGGMYSYDGLENLVGCDLHSAQQILPQYQQLEVGQKIAFGPEGYPFNTLHAFDPHHYLLTYDRLDMTTNQPVAPEAPLPPNYTQTSWLFYLYDCPQGTRLVTRGRTNYYPDLRNMLIWRVFTEPVAFVMERKMLLTIKARAENQAQA